MIVDSSVVVAVLLREPGSEALLERLLNGDPIGFAAPSLLEAGMVLSRRLKGDAMPILLDFVRTMGMEVIPFTAAHAHEALAAFGRYGKGKHPASLNFGDCMTYAAARLGNQPLLFVGNDFARTDVLRA